MRDVAVVLVGHGAPPKDLPREKIAEYMRLEVMAESGDSQAREKLQSLDRQIRSWPRDAQNDPYWAGVLELAKEIEAAGGFMRVQPAFNEFCAPTVEEAIEQVANLRPGTILVMPTMVVRGGEHSELEIPEKVEAMRKRYPGIRITYAWPFDLKALANHFAAHAKRFLGSPQERPV